MANKDDNDNGWDEYKRLILSDREATETYRKSMAESHKEMRDDNRALRSDLAGFCKEVRDENRGLRKAFFDEISGIKQEIATLKVKASLWGTLGGGIAASILAIALWLLQRVSLHP